MKQTILILIAFLSINLNAQEIKWVKNSEDISYVNYRDSLTNYQNFLTSYWDNHNKYEYEDFEDGIYSFGNSRECICHGGGISNPILLTKIYKPKTVRVIPTQEKIVYKTKIDTVFKVKEVVKHHYKIDTIVKTVTKKDTIVIKSNDKTKFTTFDNQVHILKTDSVDIPYYEKRNYDVNGRLVEKLMINPLTMSPIN